MKNPAAFLTFSALSLSLCLLAQYLCGFETEAFFKDALGIASCHAIASAFNGFAQLAHLLFGIFLYNRSSGNSCGSGSSRFPMLYFSYFSLALSFSATVLLFSHRAYIFSAFWAFILVFFIAVLLFALPRLKAVIYILCLPQLVYAVSILAFSVLGVIGQI